ncbi:hypothetical protein PSPO01_07626 [Paraphaeosphaeria sporulosa]
MYASILIWHQEARTPASSHTSLRQGHPYADAQRPTFTPLWAAGLSLGPARVDPLAGEHADGAFLSRQGSVHFANPGAMPVLPEDECEAARHLHGKAGYTPCRYGLARLAAARFQSAVCLRRPFCQSTRAAAPALPEAAPLGSIHAARSQRARSPHSSSRPRPRGPNLGMPHPAVTSAHRLAARPAPRSHLEIARDAPGLFRAGAATWPPPLASLWLNSWFPL